MGYDINFIIGLKKSWKDKIKTKEYNYVETIATYKYCVDYTLRDFIGKYDASGCFVYINDKKLAVDPYGEELRVIPIQELYNYLTSDDFPKENKEYRRYDPFKMLLESFIKNFDKFNFENIEDLVVLSYGD